MSFDTISVVGLGYIVLLTAAVLASRKKNVIGVDVSQNAIDTINRGEVHIVEPELDMAVHAAVTAGYLRATTQPEAVDFSSLRYPHLSKTTMNPTSAISRRQAGPLRPC